MKAAFSSTERPVGSLEKLKRRLAENPRSVRVAELVRVLRDLGCVETRVRGSHQVFRPRGQGPSIVIVKPHAGRSLCAVVDVRKVIALVE
jgi:predicted RNA binding protein YcfA (HicA-like mRNA interferase family)